jgi:hypothetical protein
MWTRKSTQYLQRAADKKHLLHREFLSLNHKTGDDIMTHVTNIDTIASQLRDLGVHVSDDEIIAKIICTLPESFKHMETAWDSMPMNEKTINALRARVLQEERKIKRRKQCGLKAMQLAIVMKMVRLLASKILRLKTTIILTDKTTTEGPLRSARTVLTILIIGSETAYSESAKRMATIDHQQKDTEQT